MSFRLVVQSRFKTSDWSLQDAGASDEGVSASANAAVLTTLKGLSPTDLATAVEDYVGEAPLCILESLDGQPYLLRDDDPRLGPTRFSVRDGACGCDRGFMGRSKRLVAEFGLGSCLPRVPWIWACGSSSAGHVRTAPQRLRALSQPEGFRQCSPQYDFSFGWKDTGAWGQLLRGAINGEQDS